MIVCLTIMIATAAAFGNIAGPPPRYPERPPIAVTTKVSQPSRTLTGKATWYDYHQGQAAAGSELKHLLGPKWRGQRVTVTGPRGSVTVILTDSCGCPGPRVIDLDPRDFDTISDRSAGVVDVRVARATE